ncbi:hypothetical protein NOCA2280035 [metagenome]|uniref:Uncharacterized protein n=1 Tax=metagenome TaxID=256318 RepID=A0A2P2C0P6_9ZZZZ
MTEQRLRELLRESVAHESGPDLADAAWEQSRRSRRRSRLAAVAGSVAAVVVVAGGVALLERPDAGLAPMPAPGVSSPVGEADADLDGTPVWWSPTGADEAALPSIGRSLTRLPEEIDLSARAADIATAPLDQALAAFAVLDDFGVQRLLLLGADGSYRTLDISALDPVTKPNGYLLPPESPSMLSPDGRTLLFPQDGHLELYDLRANAWRRIETGSRPTAFATWTAEGQIHLPRSSGSTSGPVYDVAGELVGAADLHPPTEGIPLGQAAVYGVTRTSPDRSSVAQSWSIGAGVPAPSDTFADPEIMVVTPGIDSSILAFPESGDQPVRWKQCCPAAGWLDDDTVVYESRKAVPQLIAWRIGTHDFHTVTTITGFTAGQESYTASWADLDRVG